MKKIAIFGGTGFVGSYIINELLKTGYFIKMINRAYSDNNHESIEELIVDLKSDLLYKELEDCDCVIYNIGIIREYPNSKIFFKDLHEDLAIHIMEMSEKAKVRKFILMSANGVERCSTNYEVTKFKAEQYLMNTKLDWTIFRPSLIFGDPKGKMEFCTQVKNDMVNTMLPLPIFFKGINIFNAGKFKMSPIHAKNVAEFFILAIDRINLKYKICNLGGSQNYTWKELLKIICSACNKRKVSILVPIFIIKLIALVLQRFSWFPVTKDQLTMLSAGNTCDSANYFSEYDIKEIKFNIKNLNYLL
tara:strand:+ start:7173 stop:8084 length:912 start_codon:yes stop_codon:yes gene_type:complete